MRAGMLKSVVVCLLVGMCCSSVFAMKVMGPTTSGTPKGQLSVGVDASYSTNDIDLEDGKDGTGTPLAIPDITVKSTKEETLTAKIGYGITDKLEGIFRIGGSNIRWDDGGERFGGGSEPSFGFGAKMTVHETENTKWGALFQVDWTESEGSATGPGYTGDMEVEYMEFQAAAGPVIGVMENVCVYTGPFCYMINGEKKYIGSGGYTEKYDIDSCLLLGAFIGTQINLGTNSRLSLEYQLTKDSNAFGLGFMLGF